MRRQEYSREYSSAPLDVIRDEGALKATIGALILSLVLMVVILAILIPATGPR